MEMEMVQNLGSTMKEQSGKIATYSLKSLQNFSMQNVKKS